jgi:uncharacterized protein (DUF2235 family)
LVRIISAAFTPRRDSGVGREDKSEPAPMKRIILCADGTWMFLSPGAVRVLNAMEDSGNLANWRALS